MVNNNPAEPEGMNDKLRGVEMQLRGLHPRQANIDLDSVTAEDRSNHLPPTPPVLPRRKNALVFAGVWMSGVLAGCLLMTIAGTFRSEPSKSPAVVVSDDPKAAETGEAVVNNQVRPTSTRQSVRKRGHVRSVMDDDSTALTSASHLGDVQLATAPTDMLLMDRHQAQEDSIETTPRTRQQMMLELLNRETL